jgi:hypothetical protein
VRAAEVLRQRLANQRLTGPLAADPVQVVRELLAVQAQDAPVARAMIALRSGTTEASVRAAVAEGRLIRTHILRPTWHYVATEDLRWLLAASAKIESGSGSRRRQLGLDAARIEAGLAVIEKRLWSGNFATRAALGSALTQAGVLAADELGGQRLTHVLMVAELRALICSAPLAEAEHHYALVDEVVPPSAERSREAAVSELTTRFIAGHGPVALRDLNRWASVTLTEGRRAVAASDLRRIEVDGHELWHSAEALPETRPQSALLLSTFDEAFLSYRAVGWPRSAGHPLGNAPYTFAQSSGGVVLWKLADVGSWRKLRRPGAGQIELVLDPTLPASAVRQINKAAAELFEIMA